MPDAERAVVRARQGGRVRQRRVEPALPVDVLLAEQPPQQRVVLLEVVVLVGQLEAEQREVLVLVALADDDLEPPAGQHVDRRVVLRHPDGVEQAEHGDAGAQQDAVGGLRERAQQDRRRRRQEVAGVPLPHRERVDAELLGQHGGLDDALEARGRVEQLAGDRVRAVGDDVEDLELHERAPCVSGDGVVAEGQQGAAVDHAGLALGEADEAEPVVQGVRAGHLRAGVHDDAVEVPLPGERDHVLGEQRADPAPARRGVDREQAEVELAVAAQLGDVRARARGGDRARAARPSPGPRPPTPRARAPGWRRRRARRGSRRAARSRGRTRRADSCATRSYSCGATSRTRRPVRARS